MDKWICKIGVTQIFEHAATSSEFLLGKYRRDRYFNPYTADYHFGYCYLQQKGIIGIRPTSDPSCVTFSGIGFLSQEPTVVPTMMFLFTQIALNVGGPTDVSNVADWPSAAGNMLSRSRVVATNAATVFAKLLVHFESAAEIVIEETNGGGSWLDAADAVCFRFHFPLYSESIVAGVSSLEKYLSSVEGSRENRSSTFAEAIPFLASDKPETMLQGLRNLLANPDASVCPVLVPGQLPSPMLVLRSLKGERRHVGATFPWIRSKPVFYAPPTETRSYWLEEERLVRGRCDEHPVPCYPPLKDDESAEAYAVWPCTSFKTCREAWADGKTDFCTNHGWRTRRTAWYRAINTSLNTD
jgi:hypothetical protein